MENFFQSYELESIYSQEEAITELQYNINSRFSSHGNTFFEGKAKDNKFKITLSGKYTEYKFNISHLLVRGYGNIQPAAIGKIIKKRKFNVTYSN